MIEAEYPIPIWEELVQDIGLPMATIRRQINRMEWWIDIDPRTEPNSINLSIYFARQYVEHKVLGLTKRTLLTALRDVFEGWTSHQFS